MGDRGTSLNSLLPPEVAEMMEKVIAHNFRRIGYEKVKRRKRALKPVV